MKLRPKGEGERRYISKVKGPLIVTSTALLMFYPICLAEAATSSALGLPLQSQSQTAIGMQRQNLPKTNPIRLLPRAVPSTNEIDSLKSTLSNYQTQLARLKSQTPLNPANRSALDATIQSVEEKISTLQARISALTSAQKAYELATSTLTKAETDLSNAQEEKRLAEAALASATVYKEQIATSLEAINLKVEAAKATLTSATSNKEATKAALDAAGASVARQTTALASAQALLNSAANTAGLATANLLSAQSALETAESNLNSAIQAANEAQDIFNTAQENYNTQLIPDPNWTAPTQEVQHTRQVANTRTVEVRTLVPHTTYTTTGGVLAQVYNRNGYNNAPPLPTSNETPIYTTTVPNINFEWGSGQIFQSGRSEDVIVKFTGNLLFPQDGYYQFYTPADDGTKLNIAGMDLIDDWFDKGGGGSISQQIFIRGGVLYPFTLYYYENGGGAAVSLQYYSLNTPYLQVVPAAYLGNTVQETTTYEEVITYEEETYYTEEVYTTIEPVQFVEKTIQVDIGEGGQATFTAPAGSTFTYSNLRYESYNDPNCGANVYPNIQGLSSVTLSANNSIFGDPCGGQVKHLVGTITYLGTPTAPLIKDPALLPALEAATTANEIAQANFHEAQDAFFQQESVVSVALADKNVADNDLATAQSTLDLTQADLQTAEQEKATAEQQFTAAEADVATAQTIVDTHVAEQTTTQTTLTEAATQLEEATTSHEEATNQVVAQEASVTSAKTTFTEATTDLTTSYERVQTAPKPDQELTKAEEIITEPAPEPEEGSKEIPAELSAENLMSVDLTKVDPTELTPAQAEQLVEAALETFETATEGSPEYEQALDALYLAAEQDDIELSPELAAIPGLAAATELINFFGNAGADMSPKKREESKKVVVTAVVAAGAAIQAAAGAATSAAASASAPSGGSSRKIK